MATVGLEAYLRGMHVDSMTCGWDVAVSYDQEKINALLAQRFSQPGSDMTTKVDIQEKVQDRQGYYYQNYDFRLGPPLIQFQSSSSPTCSLKTKIVSGSIWDSELDDPDTKENEQELAADTYSITISNINLSALDGNANNVGGGGDTITFPENDKSDRSIVIDIPTSGEQLNFSIDYPAAFDAPYAMQRDSLATALKTYFKKNINTVAYTLAQINNYKPTSGTLDLVPRAFRFVTYDVNESLSFLTILVQTRGSSSPGNTKDVQAEWITNWSTKAKVPPVPSNQSASIIINNSFFLQSFIKPGLSQATSVSEIAVPSSDSTGGLAAQCQWRRQTTDKKDYSKGFGDFTKWPLEYTWSELHVPSVEYDPNNGTPLTLTFGHANGFGKPATLNVYWKYSFKSTWTGKQIKRYSIYDEGGIIQWMPSTKNCEGSYNTTYTLNKTIDLTNLSDENLSINIGVGSGDWQIDAVPDAGNGFWGDIASIFGGVAKKGEIPSWVKENAMKGINFTFSFGTLRFFSVTNILLPGRKVIEVNIKNGLGIPRDCVVVGNVVKSIGNI